MSWTQGTQLRRSDGIYQWPHPALLGEDEAPVMLPSVTTIRNATMASDDAFIHGWYVAKYAADLTELAKKKQMAWKWERTVDKETGEIIWGKTDCRPIDILENPNLMKHEGFRQIRIAQDRGTCAHQLLHLYCEGAPVDANDLGEFAEDVILTKRLSCEIEETLPYLQSLHRWLEEHKPWIALAEHPVFNFRVGYAGTMDGVIRLTGEHAGLYVLDLKTSESTGVEHAVQLAAYRHATHVGIPGTAELRPMVRTVGGAVLLCQPGKCTLRKWVGDKPHWEEFKRDAKSFRYLADKHRAVTVKELSTR